jgi:hypothetical protein
MSVKSSSVVKFQVIYMLPSQLSSADSLGLKQQNMQGEAGGAVAAGKRNQKGGGQNENHTQGRCKGPRVVTKKQKFLR